MIPMPDESWTEITVSEPQVPAAGAGEPRKKVQLLELLVFLFLIVPSMVYSFIAIEEGEMNFALVATATILRDMALVCLIFYYLWRNGEPISRIGWNFRNGASDLWWGIVLFIVTFVVTGYVQQFFQHAGLKFPNPHQPISGMQLPHTNAQLVLAGFLVAVVAIAEETIFRGYLMLRLTLLTRSTGIAIFVSSFIFSLGHGYEGTGGAATVGVMGIIFALVFVWRRSLVAPMVMHFCQDFIGLVLIPLALRH